jgi:dTDP-4-amino-4,6-dideoxygalactose transaminase
LSFHETKNFTCGEGGAILINDPKFIERAEVIREKGTNRARFFRGQVDKYTWVDFGSSYLPSDILAAFLCAQLESRVEIQAKRRAVWTRYFAGLADWAADNGVGLPKIPPESQQAYHMFYVLMATLEDRTRLISHLDDRGIQAVFHYVPLHSSPMGRRFNAQAACPVSERVSACLVRLPFYKDLAEGDQDRVIDSVTSFRPAHRGSLVTVVGT